MKISNYIDQLFDPYYGVSQDNKALSKPELFRYVLAIAIPSMVESVLISFINSADVAMVGKLGSLAVDAIAICGQPKYIVLAPIRTLATMMIIMISRCKGDNNKEKATSILKTGVYLSIVLAAIMTVISYVFAGNILRFAGALDEYLDYSILYYRIFLIGLFFYAIGLVITSAQRGIGKTTVSLYTNISANVINLFFNFLLIEGRFGLPALGIKGAAIASAIGNFASFVIALVSVMNRKSFICLLNKCELTFKEDSLEIWKLGKYMLVEQIITRFGYIYFTSTVSHLGVDEYAAHSIIGNFFNYSLAVAEGLQIATTSLVGQTINTEKKEMSVVYMNTNRIIGTYIAIFLAFVTNVFARPICGLFTKKPEVIEYCRIPLVIVSVTMFVQICLYIYLGALRAYRETKFVSRTQIIGVVLIRPLGAFLLIKVLQVGVIGAWIAMFCDQFTRLILCIFKLKKVKVVNS